MNVLFTSCCAGNLVEVIANCQLSARLHVVDRFVPQAAQLWYDAGGDPNRAREEVRERAVQMLNEMAARLEDRGLTVETVVRDGKPGRVIIAEPREWNADVIMVGSQGHLQLVRLLVGSVARHLLQHPRCPMEVVRPNKKRSLHGN